LRPKEAGREDGVVRPPLFGKTYPVCSDQRYDWHPLGVATDRNRESCKPEECSLERPESHPNRPELAHLAALFSDSKKGQCVQVSELGRSICRPLQEVLWKEYENPTDERRPPRRQGVAGQPANRVNGSSPNQSRIRRNDKLPDVGQRQRE
jgi:hypothetical protein